MRCQNVTSFAHCSQSLDWLEIEVVIKMQVCKILAMYQKIQHIESLAADLKSSFNPVDCGLLEELCLLQGLQQVFFSLCFWLLFVQLVQDESLEQFLV